MLSNVCSVVHPILVGVNESTIILKFVDSKGFGVSSSKNSKRSSSTRTENIVNFERREGVEKWHFEMKKGSAKPTKLA